MSSLGDPLDFLKKRLEQKGRLYYCDNDLVFLECLSGGKIHIRVEVEEDCGEKREFTVASYKVSGQPAKLTGAYSAEALSGESRPSESRETSERSITTTTATTSAVSDKLVPTSSCASPKRGAPGISTQPPTKRQQTSQVSSKSATATSTPTSSLAPGRLNANATPITRPLQALALKLKSSVTTGPSWITKDVPIYDSDIPEDGNDQFDHPHIVCKDVCNDKAKGLYGMLMEAATSTHEQPNHFRGPVHLCSKKKPEREETTKRAFEIVTRNANLDDKSGLGRLSLVSLCLEFADLVHGELQKKGQTFDTERNRSSRTNKKYGKWDVNNKDLAQVMNDIFMDGNLKIPDADSKYFMLEAQTGKNYRPPGSYDMRNRALEIWCLGRKCRILLEQAGPGAIWFAAWGASFYPQYSLKKRFRPFCLSHKGFIDGDMRFIRFDRHMFTAYADESCLYWRKQMEDYGIPIDATLDPPMVQPGDMFYRGAFNEGARTYNVEMFSPKEIKTYITNRTVGTGSSGIPDWEEHITKHGVWSRKYPCCAVWNKPPIQVFDTEIPELGRALRATRKLNPGDYVAEHAGVCRREEQCTKDGETGNQSRKEKDRMELVIPGGGKWLIYQESKWSLTKYANHYEEPNIEWVTEEVSNAYRILLRVKEGCCIMPGGELTVDYGNQYWRGKPTYNGPRFILH